VADLYRGGREVIIVSSGAIAAGMRLLGLRQKPAAVEQKQALAAVGQPELMRAWAEAFGKRGLKVAQVLLTREDLLARKRYQNARKALEAVLGRGVVPVVNENDAVAVEEIRMGDNDSLSALVALMCGADLLVLLTDVDGLHRGDPRREAGAERVEVVERITAETRRWAGARAGSEVGSGGMPTKLVAAGMVTRAGHAALIARGTDPDVLARAFRGEAVGTLFPPGGARMSSHEGWLAFGVRPAGTVVVDAGARAAVVERGKSLLPKGVVRVMGEFSAGDAVAIEDERGEVFARGIAGYSSEELARVRAEKWSTATGWSCWRGGSGAAARGHHRGGERRRHGRAGGRGGRICRRRAGGHRRGTGQG
jgi:glutamate 5-kinase